MAEASLSSSNVVDQIKSLINLKKEVDKNVIKAEDSLHKLELEYLREVNGVSSSIVRGLDGYLGIRSVSGTPLTGSRSRRQSSAMNSLSGMQLLDEERIFTRAALNKSSKNAANHSFALDEDVEGKERFGSSIVTSDEDDFAEEDSDYEGSQSRRR